MLGTHFLTDVPGQMLDLKLPVLVEFDLGVMHLTFDHLLGFLFPEPFGRRRGLQNLMVAWRAVPKGFRVVPFWLEQWVVRLPGEHRFGSFRCHRRAVVRCVFEMWFDLTVFRREHTVSGARSDNFERNNDRKKSTLDKKKKKFTKNRNKNNEVIHTPAHT